MNLMEIPINEMIQSCIDNFTIDGQDVCNTYIWRNYIIRRAVKGATITGSADFPKIKRKNRKGAKSIHDKYYKKYIDEFKKREIAKRNNYIKDVENQVDHLLSKINGY